MSQTHVESDHESRPSTPHWVKVSGVIVIVIVVLIGIMVLSGGEHGPNRHTPAIEQTTQQP
jgi:hypothetical protein